MIIRHLHNMFGLETQTLRAIRDLGTFVLVLTWGIWMWHPVLTPLLLGFLYGGNELGFIHGAGHNLHVLLGKSWRTTAPRSLLVYRYRHMAHHIVEARIGTQFDEQAMGIRREFRVTPRDVWVFILLGHLAAVLALSPLIFVAAMATIRDDASLMLVLWRTLSACALAWVGVLSFYAIYEFIHWCTHRQDRQVLWAFRSRLHDAHHRDSKSNFGILAPLNTAEHMPLRLSLLTLHTIRAGEQALNVMMPSFGHSMASQVRIAEVAQADAQVRATALQKIRA